MVRAGVLVLNIAPRWRAAWWRWGDYPRKVASDSTLRISEFPGLPPVPAETGKLFRHALLHSNRPPKLPPKRPVQNRRKQGVEFGCRLGLQRFQLIDFGLQVVEVGDDAALFGEGWDRNWKARILRM